jgi:REP element-mobilizing transposase RayT
MGRPPRLRADLYRGLQRYLLTACTIERQRHFVNGSLTTMVTCQLLQTATDYSFEVIAYCFMPDHLHCFVESVAEQADFLKFVAMFKQRSAFAFTKLTSRRLWQGGFHDRVLRDEESTLSVAAYIIQNPVRARLCDDPRRYPFMGSSRYTIDELLEAIAWRPESCRP